MPPADLIAVADDIGMPLLEVLATPFAAVVKRMRNGLPTNTMKRSYAHRAPNPGSPARSEWRRIAYRRASGGYCPVKVLIPVLLSGDVIESHPRSLDLRLVDDASRGGIRGRRLSSPGTVITYQCIKVTPQDVRRVLAVDCRAVVVGGPDTARPCEFTSGTGLREAGPSAGGPS